MEVNASLKYVAQAWRRTIIRSRTLCMYLLNIMKQSFPRHRGHAITAEIPANQSGMRDDAIVVK